MEDYKVGDLVTYEFNYGIPVVKMTAMIIDIDDLGYYLIKFLADGSTLDVVHSEINHLEVA